MRADYINDNSGKSNLDVKYINITADTTLTADQSGSLISMDANGVDITLPSAAPGLNYVIIQNADYDTAVCTVVQAAATEDFYGHVYSAEHESAGTDGDTGASGDTKITFSSASKKGDSVELISDGSVWYVKAHAANYAGITFDA